jgi:hypothetical protein
MVDSRAYRTHLTYMGKESEELSIGLKGRVGKWT